MANLTPHTPIPKYNTFNFKEEIMTLVSINEYVCTDGCIKINLFNTSDWKRAKLAVTHLKSHTDIILSSDT